MYEISFKKKNRHNIPTCTYKNYIYSEGNWHGGRRVAQNWALPSGVCPAVDKNKLIMMIK